VNCVADLYPHSNHLKDPDPTANKNGQKPKVTNTGVLFREKIYIFLNTELSSFKLP
jgi:hypothetical protein